MYPETDVPPVEPDPSDVDRPELLDEKAERYTEAFGLDAGLAEQVAFGQRFPPVRDRGRPRRRPHLRGLDTGVDDDGDPARRRARRESEL